MSDGVVVLVVLASGTYALKAAGPLVLGRRPLPAGAARLVELLPAALLAALAAVSTLGDGRALSLDARLVGLLAASVALRLRLPFVVVVALASAATAVARLAT